MKYNPHYPLRHLSVRVPWHDKKWNGCVCDHPHANTACLILKNCALNRDDNAEESVAGQKIDSLVETQHPVCVKERGTFMSPYPLNLIVRHPYVSISPNTHGHLKPTNLHLLPYSTPAVPFLWMLKTDSGFDKKIEQYELDYDPQREPELSWDKNGGNWVQEIHNQKAMLNCFFQHFEKEQSLVFFYAKRVPFVESTDRVIVGVGRIKNIHDCKEYDGSNSRFGAAYWEHDVVHSIRPDEKDGFLLPYHEAIEYQKEHPNFDPSEIAVLVPSDKFDEFSYGSEHVTNDSAIQVLLRCLQSLEKADALGIGKNHRVQKDWIHNEIAKIQKLRGNYPGMGSALCAFGMKRGHFVAASIIAHLKEGEDAWELFEDIIKGKNNRIPSSIEELIEYTPKKLYLRYLQRQDKNRLNFLHLLSRFELSIEQAKILWVEEERTKEGIERKDSDYIDNPYLIFEDLMKTDYPISIGAIDLGLYIKAKKIYPNNLVYHDQLDLRRIKALAIQQLEIASTSGHTLMTQQQIVLNIRSLDLIPDCNVTGDYLDLAESIFNNDIIRIDMPNNQIGYQLYRYTQTREIISEKVERRIHGKRFISQINWNRNVEQTLSAYTTGKPDEVELRARQEKAVALKELYESRFSVLIGPAGTGKTTLLSIFAKQPEIKNNGILLLAPTGKARVNMETMVKDLNIQAQTLAQFLSGYDRYDGKYQRYILSNKFCENKFGTVILDEASMLTEEMLATTMDCLKDAKRFILVGDHRQLPPIGAGRPFVDIITHLRPSSIETSFPKVGKGYAELTVKRRQGGQQREDLRLADWFSGEALDAGADQIINDIFTQKESKYLRLVNWKNESDFENVFETILVDELNLSSIHDILGFNSSLGAVNGRFFNGGDDIKKIESWQILSPVRERVFGVNFINRYIHKLFRRNILDASRKKNRLPDPLGSEEIVYGDKVINIMNQHRKDVYPKDSLAYVANGEIGVSLGFQTKKMKYRPDYHEIEFTSQAGVRYKYKPSEFKEEADSPLELAYALTVHKAQGSGFKKVFLIVPNPCVLLTREMIYTALTRQEERVIILYQGDVFDIKEMASPIKSDIIKRVTNLFGSPELVKVENDYYSKNLIHQASDGTMLRSKSELLIYQTLLEKGLHPIYEKELVIDGVTKIPDFTIEDNDSGVVYYWEHLGMLDDPEYRQRWEAKKAWYIQHNIVPFEDGGGEDGTLITSQDEVVVTANGDSKGSIQIPQIERIIKRAFGV